MTLRFRTGRRKDGCRTVTAYIDGQKVGHIGGCQSSQHLEVLKVHVVEGRRREKIGTRLYEEMGKLACALGKPLASSAFQRNASSDEFWEKQIRLGRGEKIGGMSVLHCPITSLGRFTRRR